MLSRPCPARPPAPPPCSTRIQQNNVYVAPPVVGGWGFGMPFFGGGFGGFGFYPV